MKFNANEIGSLLVEEIANFQGQVETREVGRVLEVGDGIARVHGLSSAMAGEMVEFPGGVRGQVFNLEENSVGIIILGDYKKIQEGDEVRRGVVRAQVGDHASGGDLERGEQIERAVALVVMRRSLWRGGQHRQGRRGASPCRARRRCRA